MDNVTRLAQFLFESARNSQWHVRPDDELGGGYVIMNHPTLTPATILPEHRREGIQVVVQMVQGEVAEYIAALHNATLTENESTG